MAPRSRNAIADRALVAAREDTSTTAGTLAARAWLHARGLSSMGVARWYAEILLDVVDQRAREQFDERVDTRFRIQIYCEEWGLMFCHAGRASWIRVTDIPFAHGHDEFGLLASTPPLKDLGVLLRAIEHQHVIRFRRPHAVVRTNLPRAEAAIRRWVESL
jgi:hypothetical protein